MNYIYLANGSLKIKDDLNISEEFDNVSSNNILNYWDKPWDKPNKINNNTSFDFINAFINYYNNNSININIKYSSI